MPNAKNPKSKIQNPKSHADLLLEIGTEELPAAYLYLPRLIEQLGDEAKTLLTAQHLAFKQVESFGTPRRLVLLVRGLSAVQRKPAEEIRGPSRQASYDKDGKPTQALLGFLRSRGGTLDRVGVVSSDRGEHVVLRKPPTETPIMMTLLPRLPQQLIGKLRAPKTMRWDESGRRFARPIRWMLALYGSQSIRTWVGGEFEPEGTTVIRRSVRSGAATRIGRPQALRRVRIISIAGYLQTLKRAGVILDQVKRRDRIRALVEREAQRVHGVIAPEMIRHGLLDEVTYLTESPEPLAGSFDPKYLELPREVLLASMSKHQRVFALEADGKLLPRWVAILEGKPGKPEAVQAVIERILNVRLADSLIFWNEDRKRSLEQMVAALSGVTFHEQLGTMAEKTKRLETLSETLIANWQIDEAQANKIRRAAHFAKADLVTHLVREFPSLQGVIGKYYVLAAREDEEEVASAIEQQYWLEDNEAQRHLNAGRIPRSLTSLALTIVEKYDTLASYFGIGIEPTGNADPFGLRPRAQGIVETAVWLIGSKPLSLNALFRARAAFAPFSSMSDTERLRVASRIERYLLDRLYTLNPLWSESHDVIDAVLASPSIDDVTNVRARIERLHQLKGCAKGSAEYEALFKSAKVIERTANILKGTTLQQADVDDKRLQVPLEQQLYALSKSKKDEFARLVERGSYDDATKLFAETFYTPLHEFFDKVMVNVPDEALRQNRLALMRAINVLYTERVADLSKLTILQSRPDVAEPRTTDGRTRGTR
ncbi:MAG: glycine--tRNA ligase subunit beta [Candidatus Omnitrophica bacterium]|nr:glycine--tRNA ligase subunit beta [Candidatus Omnitrophota bacterium]